MSDHTLYYGPVPFRGQFVRAVLDASATSDMMGAQVKDLPVPFMGPPMLIDKRSDFARRDGRQDCVVDGQAPMEALWLVYPQDPATGSVRQRQEVGFSLTVCARA